MSAALAVAMAAALLLPAAVFAQGGEGNATAGAAQGGDTLDAWVVIGVALALAAVGGAIWNGIQIHRHVSLVKKDDDERLRPMLRWTSEGDRRVYPPSVTDGKVIVIKILNAGQVAAVGIVCDVRFGMEGDFGSEKVGHSKNEWGSLAPNMAIHLNVHVTGEQMRRVLEGKEKFHIEIMAEYRGPGEKKYEYSMSGDYDGRETLLHD